MPSFRYQAADAAGKTETGLIDADSPRGARAQLRARGLGSAWRMTPDLKVGVVSLQEASVDNVLEVLRPIVVGPVGVSTVFDSLAHASQGVYLARLMMAAIPAGKRGVRQLEMLALLAASPDTARMMIHAVLGEVLALPVRTREPLLATLVEWLEARARSPTRPRPCSVTPIRSATGSIGSSRSCVSTCPIRLRWPTSARPCRH